MVQKFKRIWVYSYLIFTIFLYYNLFNWSGKLLVPIAVKMLNTPLDVPNDRCAKPICNRNRIKTVSQTEVIYF